MRDYICEYTCLPKCDRVKSGMLVSGCIAAAIGMLAVSETGIWLSSYFKAGALVFVFVGVLFATRLLSTGYVYAIFRDAIGGEAELVISEIKLGKSKTVCRISLYDIKEIFEYDASCKKKRIKGKKAKRQGRYYNYCTDILPSKYCIIHISGSENAYIKFSPDETMINIIKSAEIK